MTRPRRATVAAVGFATLLLAAACAEAPDTLDPRPLSELDIGSERYELVHPAPGVFATVARPAFDPSQLSASLIVVREDGVLVVDSRETPEAGRELIEQVRRITDTPVRWLVNTHWHGDHVGGNRAFLEAWPDVEIVGGRTIGEDIRGPGRERLDAQVGRIAERVEAARGWLDSGERDDGTPLTEEEMASLPDDIAETEAWLDARREIEDVVPATEISDEWSLGGRRAVRVFFVGPAHTRGDVVVYLPDSGILLAGDLLEEGLPWFGDGYPAGWSEALARLDALPFTHLFPSHGHVQDGRELFDLQRRFTDAVAAAAAEAKAAGTPVDDALSALDLSEFEEPMLRRLHRYDEMTPEQRAARWTAYVEETFRRAYETAA